MSKDSYMLEMVKDRLNELYNDLKLPNNEYIEKKREEYSLCSFSDKPISAYAIKTGEATGALYFLLSLLND